jgi:hypothetical protein
LASSSRGAEAWNAIALGAAAALFWSLAGSDRLG